MLWSVLLGMAPGVRRGRGGNARVNANCDEATRVVKKVRGHSKGLAAERIFKSSGSKLKVYFAPGDNRPSGENQGLFTAEIGIVARNHAPLQVETWNKIHESEKKILIERVLSKFDIDNSDPMVERYILKAMSSRYNDNRTKLNLHFKKFATVEEARRNKHERTTQEDWDYLCTIFSNEKFKKRSKKCSDNRAMLRYNHCGGSKSFVQYQYEDQNGNPLKEAKGDIQLFHDTHFHKENGWTDSVAKLNYERMLELQNSEENEMTEAEICREVLGQKSGYVKGRGFGPLPFSSTSKRIQETARAETKELRSEVLRLTELVNNCTETNTQLAAVLKRFQQSSPTFSNVLAEDSHT